MGGLMPGGGPIIPARTEGVSPRPWVGLASRGQHRGYVPYPAPSTFCLIVATFLDEMYSPSWTSE